MEIGETSYLVITRIPHNEKDQTFLIEEAFSIYPIIRNNCPRCGYYDAQYWEVGDRRKEEWESMTYYKCMQCKDSLKQVKIRGIFNEQLVKVTKNQ
ncbi:MAG: hypothetical protein ACFE9L_17825 [Candidatus Hodarchaeota archaeon]